ncbi:ABC transporter ATP-binding protein [Ruegeria sp. R14_0]|uniref:ABC transporter transmembrane domain-containing protein n=1 Tax=Ruegeria sp. R14_0 TaxID=2821100 RepID=UPI001ADB78BC|nr:ABC transporter ATP-binding protein [Ruegeria sp. R14_0]MBO9447383.1 ABC transporter ATP-binding protein [Ruegeria sp. R14_0]
MTPPGLFEGQRRRLFIWILFATLTQATAFAAVAIATRTAFVALHAGSDLPALPIAIVGSAGMCGALMQLAFRTLAERLGQNYAKDVRLSLFDHASRSDQRDLDQKRMGYHVLRFTGDLSAMKDWPGLGLPRLVQAAVLLPTATAVLIYLDQRFVWVAFCAVLPTAFWAALTQRKLLNAHQQQRKLRAQLAADISERLPIAPRLSALGRRKIEMKSLGRRAERVADASCARRSLSEVRKAIPEFSAAIAASLILVIGGTGGMSAGTIAAALAALGLMIRPLRNAVNSSDHAAKFRVAHNNLLRALNRPLAEPRSSKMHLRREPLSLEVTLQHGSEMKVLPGESAVISNTLMERIEFVLLGNAALGDLSLKLNGKEASQLTPGSLRRSVGVLTDQPLILKGSLRRALTLGLRRRPSDEQITMAAKNANLQNVISDIGGLGFSLAERGANLSAKQRLHISSLRLILQEPSVILVRSAPCKSFKSTLLWEKATKLATCREFYAS